MAKGAGLRFRFNVKPGWKLRRLLTVLKVSGYAGRTDGEALELFGGGRGRIGMALHVAGMAGLVFGKDARYRPLIVPSGREYLIELLRGARKP